MPVKHSRDEAEIRQLAKDLATRWRRGDGVEPWLRSLEPELSAKIRRQRWSWESIARALNIAGITYETNRPWTGRSLLRKIATIRFEGRLAQQNSASMPEPQGPPGDPAQPRVVPARPVAASARKEPPVSAPDEGGERTPEEPTFRLVTLKGGNQPPGPQPSPNSPRQEESTATKISDDEILRRVFGKP